MMEEQSQFGYGDHCLGCLKSFREHKIHDYKIQYAHFWAIFEVDTIKLCYICRRLAQHAELFIQNVQCNQILLRNCVGDILTTIEETRSQLQNPITLLHSPLDPISLPGKDDIDKTKSENDFKSKSKNKVDSKAKSIESKLPVIHPVLGCDDTKPDDNVCIVNQEEELRNIKIELKVEEDDHLDSDFIDVNDDVQDPNVNEEEDDEHENPLNLLKIECHDVQDSNVKEEEDENPLDLLKKESHNVEARKLASNQLLLRLLRKPIQGKVKKERLKVKSSARKEAELRRNEALGIKKILLTKEEVVEERRQQALDPVYLNCSYKCENCLKGFNFKTAYDKHLKRHSEETGEYVCEYCKIRMDNRDAWLSHKKCHNVRWKCTLCGLVRTNRSTLVEHQNAVHKPESQFACPYCPKTFKRQMSQRKHVHDIHENKERVTCEHCNKTYANKEALKVHTMSMHAKEVSALEQAKTYPCEECGMMFLTPTHLKKHGYKHSMPQQYYCVECDKGFNSEVALQQHLKRTQIHMSYSELPLCCKYCDKRFSVRRNLDRHMNRVHLEVKPFKCDRCDKAYVCNWSLRNHTRMAHEGYKRPLRFPCKYCDKTFGLSATLKAHIRTHTGERPYQCDKCPAQFRQSSVLATHNKLVHQSLTRDGKPKQNVDK